MIQNPYGLDNNHSMLNIEQISNMLNSSNGEDVTLAVGLLGDNKVEIKILNTKQWSISSLVGVGKRYWRPINSLEIIYVNVF